ncbi:limbic system-associated membrane protein-like isoform X2 [Ostrea edulis]|uniref:limbic system-associated membrane protein-like isoform X2 n=1 Tax=Ostrea edulis TaxID=37623 RepID=UPI002095B46D|nr:limbic system-associated membrane protein-like isoform X2 [Ostrea edulis]
MLYWIFTLLIYKIAYVSKSVATDIQRNITITEGDIAILPCEAHDEGNKYQVVWMSPKKILIGKNQRRFMDDPRISIEHTYIAYWNLHIRQIKYEDRGEYTCTVNTSPVQITRINLMVYVPARILDYASSKDMSVKEGRDVTLWCNATGIPEPNITWFRIYQNHSPSRIRVGDVGDTLIIKNISRHCGGEYECMADNGVRGAVQHTIKVEVHFPPEVKLINYKQSQTIGRETMLQCNVSASPLGVHGWRFGKREFDQPSGENYRTEMFKDDKMRLILLLRILSVGKEDFGNYTCEAKNNYGHSEKTMLLHEYTVPTQKPSFHSSSTTAHILTFSDSMKRTHPETVSRVREGEDPEILIFDFRLRASGEANSQGTVRAALWTEVVVILLLKVVSNLSGID